jgi:hypothetical protein
MGNAPLLLGLVWPKLEAPEKEGGKKEKEEMTRAA